MKATLTLAFLFLVILGFSRENPGAKHKNTPSEKAASLCNPSTAQADLDINNVRAKVLSSADMWWDLANAGYEVPIGSGKNSMFAGSLWIGGIDAGGQIKVAAQTYRQTGIDYWPGAMDTTIVDIDASRCQYYDRHWKINRQEVLDFVSSGTTTPNIISWPGNGSGTYNESNYLAPFYDNNSDGIYNHLDGDYPGYNLNATYPTFNGTSLGICNDYLFGDQTIWWVINDVGNAHTETNSLPIGLEIRCQAFAFQATTPSINNATFYKYQVINRSGLALVDAYFGQWADPDLGNAVDDYVGCDVVRGLGYCYNGDPNDDGAGGYGLNPPAIGIDFLQGPIADLNDGIDNDLDGCIDCSFVDSAGITITIDDDLWGESIIMSKFVYYNNVNNSPVGNPNGFADFYNYLRGIWLDNQPITYGGDGRNAASPVCNFMFPGSSDPVNFPVLGIWSEISAGNIPEDRRFIQSAGGFTLQPGEVNYVTTGVLWARTTSGGQNASITLLQQYDDDVQQLFDNCFVVSGVGLAESNAESSFAVYPNPTHDFITVHSIATGINFQVRLFDSAGRVVLNTENIRENDFRLDVRHLPKGTFIYEITSAENKTTSGKVVLY